MSLGGGNGGGENGDDGWEEELVLTRDRAAFEGAFVSFPLVLEVFGRNIRDMKPCFCGSAIITGG